MSEQLENKRIKIDCYGDIIYIPSKYKERIGIISIFDNNDENILLEISKTDMIRILYVLRDNLQALDNDELRKLKIKYNWNEEFLNHFHYLSIDTDAINEKIKIQDEIDEKNKNKIIEKFKNEMKVSYDNDTKNVYGISVKTEISRRFYNRNKIIIDKIICDNPQYKNHGYFTFCFDRCRMHPYIVLYNSKDSEDKAIKSIRDLGCVFECEK
jgi:hypothetical protein